MGYAAQFVFPSSLLGDFDPARGIAEEALTRAAGLPKVAMLLSLAALLAALIILGRAQQRRRREQRTLKHTQDWFSFVLENVKDYAIFLLDTTGRITSWNLGAQNILGYKPSEILGSYLGRLYPEEEAARGEPERALTEATTRGRYETEGWRLRKSGTRMWASVVLTALRDADGELKGFVKITRDMTEHKRADEELRFREKLMNSYFSASPAGLAILNLEFRFQKVNRMLCEMTGRTVEECLGKNIGEVFGALAPQVHDGLQQVAKDGNPLLNRGLYWLGTNTNKPGYWMTSFFPVVNEDGRVRLIGVLLLDITEQKQAEEALQESEETLRRLSGQLIRIQDAERRRIARELHDSVGQCLAAIKMNLHTLEANTPPAATRTLAETASLTDQCLNETRTISHLLHPPLLERLGLPSALRSYVEGFVERSGIQVELDIGPQFGRLPAELETTVFRIIQEGLTNVHRHSGSATARIRVEQDAESLNLEISDQGKGMPWARLHSCNGQTKPPGVGIAGMHERVRQLRGKLEVKSSTQGTTLLAVLPIDHSQTETKDETAAYLNSR